MKSRATSSFLNGHWSTGACSNGGTSRFADCWSTRERRNCRSSPILARTCSSLHQRVNIPLPISWRSRVLSSSYIPDVLTCIANLSSDEVFTPPQLVNRILDMLPADLWSDKKATFLDPGCKCGVFLREIAKRLDSGLTQQIPNRQQRMNHIFKNQLFGLSLIH